MLPVLSLSQDNLLHYYETRDDGLYHVIRDNNKGMPFLGRITEVTGFERDTVLIGTLPTISMKKDDLAKADIDALKLIFPQMRVARLPAETVTYEEKTVQVDMGGYTPKSEDSYFSKENKLELWRHERDITSLILAQFDYQNDLDAPVGFLKNLPEAIERFNKGEISDDTWTVWKLFFQAERRGMEVEDLENPVWKAYFEKIDQVLSLRLHPGVHRVYKIDEPSNDVRLSFEDRSALHATNGRSLKILTSPASTMPGNFIGATSSQDTAAFTVDKTAVPSKGIIELERHLGLGASVFIPVSDTPYPAKVRLFEATENSVATNALIAQQVKVHLDAIHTVFDSKPKPSQQVLNEKSRETGQNINRLINTGRELTLAGMRNHRLFPDSLMPELSKIVVRIEDRLKRISAVFERNLVRAENITDMDARKLTIQTLINNHIDTLRGIGSRHTPSAGENDDLKGYFINIDKRIESYDITGSFSVIDGRAIIESLRSYNAAKEQINKAILLQQQELNRASLQTVKLQDDVDLQGDLFDTSINKVPVAPITHNDVGEKIGGARKDLYNSITTNNIDQLTFDEQIKYVEKARIWPKPNWEAMIALGVKPSDAYFVKQIRDAIEPQAQQLTRSYYRKSKSAPMAKTKKDFEYWLQSVEFIKDKIKSIQSGDDFRPAMEAISHFLNQPVDDEHKAGPGNFDGATTNLHALGHSFKKKYDFAHEFINAYNREDRSSIHMSDAYYNRKLGIKPKVESGAALDEEDDAVGGDVSVVEKIAKPKLPYPEHLKKLTRIGNDWRNGKDITGEDLIDTFGFRGIEYGNWVANKERQLILNHAYDAFMDLAYIIGIPQDKLNMISMNGDLALGFGSRGHGKVLAHYEPLRDVINITKIKGAGSLGHEWFHAFDAYLGRLTNMGHARERLFSEVLFKLDPHERRTKMAAVTDEAVLGMTAALYKTVKLSIQKPRTQENIAADIEAAFIRSGAHLGGWARTSAHKYLRSIGNENYPDSQNKKTTDLLKATKLGEIPYNGEQAVVAIIATMQVMTELLRVALIKSAIEAGSDETSASIAADAIIDEMPGTEIMGALNKLAPAYQRQNEKLADTLMALMSDDCKRQADVGIGWLKKRIIEAETTKDEAETNFYLDAKKLDGKARTYWQSPCELLARSFSVAIYDKLLEEGMQSDYLVRGAVRNEFADELQFKANSNPEGAERDTLNDAHGELLTALSHYAQNLSDKAELSPSI